MNQQDTNNFKLKWEESGYKDNLGGFHDSGVGWMPNGKYCGICGYSSCEDCSIWKWELKRQALKNEKNG